MNNFKMLVTEMLDVKNVFLNLLNLTLVAGRIAFHYRGKFGHDFPLQHCVCFGVNLKNVLF